MLGFSRLQSLLIKRAICSTSKLNGGYIVLVPEIGEENENGSTIINADGLPKFNNLTVENCLGNIGKQAVAVEKTVKNIEQNIIQINGTKYNIDKNNVNNNDKNVLENNIENLKNLIFNPLERVTCDLETIWGIAKTLYYGNSSLMPTKYYLNIHDRAKRARSSKFHSPIIYDYLSKSTTNPSIMNELTIKRLADKYLLEGKLNGLLLSEENKKQLISILTDISKERTTIKNKVDTSIRQFSHMITNYSLVRNFPPELLTTVATDHDHPTKGPWKITLQPYIVDEFLKYCPDRNERWNVWQANVRKASGQNDKSMDTSTHIEIMRSLRRRQAQLLGYKNYAEMSMQTKMIKSVENLKQIFTTLRKHARHAQEKELNHLQEFALKNGFQHKLELHDLSYWKRKHLKSEYNLDEEIIREYFPLSHVMKEIMSLCEDLFEIKFVERKNSEVWHESVKYYDIFMPDNNSNNPVAGLYLDFYSRENEIGNTSTADATQLISTNLRNPGCMITIRNRSNIQNSSQITTPLSALIFNFGQPIYGKSYLLTINDLKCILRNFGMSLQHLLTQAKYSDIAGLSNIEWDAAEICGYVMQNLLENNAVLKRLSCHYSTEEQLNLSALTKQKSQDNSKLLILQNYNDENNLIKIFNNHMAGYNLCQQLYLSDLDLELNIRTEFWLNIVKKLWPQYFQIEYDKKNNHVCSWLDVFSGDWGSAYFSHLHAKMIADDITSSFELSTNDNNHNYGTTTTSSSSSSSSSPSVTDTETSSLPSLIRFRDMFLCNDGTLSTAEIFRRYRGRDPSPLPLLKRSNLFNSSLESIEN